MLGDTQCYENGCEQSRYQPLGIRTPSKEGCYNKHGDFTGSEGHDTCCWWCPGRDKNGRCPDGDGTCVNVVFIEPTTNGTYKLFDLDGRNLLGTGKVPPEKFCLRGEAWVNDTIPKVNGEPDRFRFLTGKGLKIYASAVKDGKMPEGAVSCRTYYAPELKLFNLELGLSPDVAVPKGWSQYPFENGNDGNAWWKIARSELYAIFPKESASEKLYAVNGLLQPHSVKQCHRSQESKPRITGIMTASMTWHILRCSERNDQSCP